MPISGRRLTAKKVKGMSVEEYEAILDGSSYDDLAFNDDQF